MKRLFIIGWIWLGCALAWVVLGSSIVSRSGEATGAMTREVHLLWGPPIRQKPPRAVYLQKGQTKETVTSKDAEGRSVSSEIVREVETEVEAPLSGSDIEVTLDLEHRQRGLLWFPTYEVDFRARYTFDNPTDEERTLEMRFPVIVEDAMYDGLDAFGADGAALPTEISGGLMKWRDTFAPGERRTFDVTYRSRGTAWWRYEVGDGSGRAKNFHMTMATDFADVDFPAGTLSPSRHETAQAGWRGRWDFTTLVASSPIGVELPQKLNPGPLAARITFFAPVGLLFYFFVVAVVSEARKRSIHPLNFFFFGCAFFAFHLLFAYLLDHLAVVPAFAIASAVSVALVVTYARLFVGWRYAIAPIGVSQLVYLVLFSLTFLWTGFTGLAITVGAITTLFVMMQITGRDDWGALSGPACPPPPATVPGIDAPCAR